MLVKPVVRLQPANGAGARANHHCVGERVVAAHLRPIQQRPRGDAGGTPTVALLWSVLVALLSTGDSAMSAQCGPNPIVCENAQPGAPASEWDVSGAGDTVVAATAFGLAAGLTVPEAATIANAAAAIAVARPGIATLSRAELLAAAGISPSVLCIGLPDAFAEQGSQEELWARYGLDASGIADRIRHFLGLAGTGAALAGVRQVGRYPGHRSFKRQGARRLAGPLPFFYVLRPK